MDESCPHSVLGIPFFTEVITVTQMEVIAVDANVLSNDHVLRFDYFATAQFVFTPLQKLTRPEPRVFVVRLVDLQTIIIQEISNDETTISILRFRISKNSIKPQRYLLVDPLEKVLHWRFRHQSINVTQ